MYKLSKNGIIRLSDNAFIPKDPDNRHYLKYLQWLNEGNEPIPEYVPIECIDKSTYEIDNDCVITKLKNQLLRELSFATQRFIDSVFRALDEDMSDIATELDRLKSYIKYWLVKGKTDGSVEVNFTIDDLYLLAARYIANEITLDQIYNAIDELQLTDEAKENIKSKIPRIAEIVKLIELKERIWDIEANLENRVNNITNVNEILNSNIIEIAMNQYTKILDTFYSDNEMIQSALTKHQNVDIS